MNEPYINRVFNADATAMPALPDGCVDALVTDPPAGIEFMGAQWDSFRGDGRQPGDATLHPSGSGPHDRASIRYGTSSGYGNNVRAIRARFTETIGAVFTECLRVLKPGAHGVVWALPRTAHWTTLALEDAGFEIGDVAVHLFGQGFPKSKNLPGGLGTALKPAAEHWILVRKPMECSVAQNVAHYGTGALNIDACRIGSSVPEAGNARVGEQSALNRYTHKGSTNFAALPGPRGGDSRGRWPANVTLDEGAAAMLDQQSGLRCSGAPGTSIRHDMGYMGGCSPTALTGYGDRGGASRFFFIAKANQRERNFSGPTNHPTIKPLDLMRYLVRLVTPPGGLVLDPFAGSGTTLEAALSLGMRYVGYERDARYLPVIQERLRQGTLLAEPAHE